MTFSLIMTNPSVPLFSISSIQWIDFRFVRWRTATNVFFSKWGRKKICTYGMCFIYSITDHWSIHSFLHSFIHSLIPSSIHSLITSSIHSFIHSFTHHPFIHLYIIKKINLIYLFDYLGFRIFLMVHQHGFMWKMVIIHLLPNWLH